MFRFCVWLWIKILKEYVSIVFDFAFKIVIDYANVFNGVAAIQRISNRILYGMQSIRVWYAIEFPGSHVSPFATPEEKSIS